MRKWICLFLLGILAAGAFAGWKYRDQVYSAYLRATGGLDVEATAKPDPDKYDRLIAEVAAKRLAFQKRYSQARTAAEISGVMDEARSFLEEKMPEMMRCWLGTPWDFHGTCQKPGSGKIACGYYVSTILRDAGFKVERVKMARQASQNILRTMLPKEKMHIRAGMGYEKFLDQVTARGAGIHIVGLDSHVAFLVVGKDGEVRFIHSSGAAPKKVVDEDRKNADVLRRSKYRVIGNLTAHDDLIHRWLMGQSFPTRTSS